MIDHLEEKVAVFGPLLVDHGEGHIVNTGIFESEGNRDDVAVIRSDEAAALAPFREAVESVGPSYVGRR